MQRVDTAKRGVVRWTISCRGPATGDALYATTVQNVSRDSSGTETIPIMLTPTTEPIADFKSSFEPKTEYQLRDVRLEIPDKSTAVFSAKTQGPVGATAWVRAWGSNESEGTLAQAEIGNVSVGDEVSLTVVLDREATPEMACMRIESGRLATEHTVHIGFN